MHRVSFVPNHNTRYCSNLVLVLIRTLEATVMKTFTESLNAMDLSIYTEQPVKDWKSAFCTEHQEALKQEILKIL